MNQLNYSLKAAECFQNPLARKYLDKDSLPIMDVLTDILLFKSVKFLLPSTGTFLDLSNYTKSHFDLFKIPYPICVFEWRLSREQTRNWSNYQRQHGSGRIVIAIERAHPVLTNLPSLIHNEEDIQQDGVWLIAIHQTDGKWLPNIGVKFAPYINELPNNIDPNNGFTTASHNFPFLQSPWDRIIQESGERTAYNQIADELNEFHWAVLEACALLNCENVHVERTVVPIKLQKKRINNGKHPFHEYKLLKIGEKIFYGTENSIATDTKTRTHLRRGHIRRLGNGGTTWVRNAIVNPDGKSIISKAYDLS